MKYILLLLLNALVVSCSQVIKLNNIKNQDYNLNESIQDETSKVQILESIGGTYRNSEETKCNIQLVISKSGQEYFYEMKTDDREELKGVLSFFMERGKSCL